MKKSKKDTSHKLNVGDEYEHICKVVLTKEEYPIAFENAVQELLEEFDNITREEAEQMVSNDVIELEIYYEKGFGLFAIDSNAVTAGKVYSPYSRRKYTK